MEKTSRRAFLASAPAAALFVGPLAIAGVDPIFAAIERHKEAFRIFADACTLIDKVAARNDGRQITEADESAYDAASLAEEKALDGLFEKLPTTREGLRAAIEWLAEYDRGGIPETSGEFLAALLKSPLLAA